MSITFYCPEAPQVVKDTYDCQCTDWPELGSDPDPDCFSCKGEGQIVFHGKEIEINVSNVNGLELLPYLGLPAEYYGKVESDELSDVLRHIMVHLNRGIDDPGYETTVEEGETRLVTDRDGSQRISKGATMIRAGRQAGYVSDRLKQFQALFKQAVDNGWEVHWG